MVAPRVADKSTGHDAVVVALAGEHDLATVDRIAEAFAGAIATGDGDLIVDLSDVEFMDASTIAVLFRTRFLLRQRGRGLVVRAPSPSARYVLRLCGSERLLPSGDTLF
jgi:anti-anti-sigma factor